MLELPRLPNAEACDHSIDVRALRLRRKVDADASLPAFIFTPRGAGHLFEAGVETVRWGGSSNKYTSVVQPCRTFPFRFRPAASRPTSGRPSNKCRYLHQLQRCCMDRKLALTHVRVQNWFPLQIQICLDGHEWLARELDRRGIGCCKLDGTRKSCSSTSRGRRRVSVLASVAVAAIVAPMRG